MDETCKEAGFVCVRRSGFGAWPGFCFGSGHGHDSGGGVSILHTFRTGFVRSGRSEEERRKHEEYLESLTPGEARGLLRASGA